MRSIPRAHAEEKRYDNAGDDHFPAEHDVGHGDGNGREERRNDDEGGHRPQPVALRLHPVGHGHGCARTARQEGSCQAGIKYGGCAALEETLSPCRSEVDLEQP